MRKQKLPAPTIYEKAIALVAPQFAGRVYRTRCAMELAESYTGASKTRRGVSEFNPSDGDADADILPYLDDLRCRSRDLVRNDCVAGAIIGTKTTSVVGTGLKLQARPNRDILGLSDEEADAWETLTEAEFALFAAGCDWERVQSFYEQQELAFRSTFESGDVLVVTPYRKDPGQAYGTKIQFVEADRIRNKDNQIDTDSLSGGVQRANGMVYSYHVTKQHPGNTRYGAKHEWDVIPAWGKSGRRNAWLLYHKTRIGQFRGIPDLAPVIEELKQLSRYKEAELMAAVVASMFTVFIKNSEDGGDFDYSDIAAETGQTSTDKTFKLGNGAIVDLADGEDISIANPGRPNQAFEGFVNAIITEIGARVEIPFEVLTKRFQSSYSAARGALLEAWKYYSSRRKWLADNFCKPIYELFLTEAVYEGRINAPGFLSGDPLIRQAWLGSEWVGDAPGHIDEGKAADAAKKRIDAGLSNESIETTALTGRDRDAVYRGRKKEVEQRRRDNMMLQDLNTPAVKNTEADNDKED